MNQGSRVQGQGYRVKIENNEKKTAGVMNVIRLSLISLILLFLAVPSIAADEWRQATGQRTWSFPRDHGAHPEFRTEWWYFTGNLRDGAGNRYGYQLTFFRQGVRLKPADPKNPWSLRDLYPAHFAVTDVSNEQVPLRRAGHPLRPGAFRGRSGRHERLEPGLVSEDEGGRPSTSGPTRRAWRFPWNSSRESP